MLEPAAKYKHEIDRLLTECMYDEKYKFLTGGPVAWRQLNSQDNGYNEPFYHCYASVKDNKVLGFIEFHVRYSTKSAYGFSLINFGEPNVTFGRDVLSCVDMCFNKFGLNRIDFRCIDGNKALNMYRKFAKKYRSYEHRLHECAQTWDGEIRDCYIFEIFKTIKNKRK